MFQSPTPYEALQVLVERAGALAVALRGADAAPLLGRQVAALGKQHHAAAGTLEQLRSVLQATQVHEARLRAQRVRLARDVGAAQASALQVRDRPLGSRGRLNRAAEPCAP